jgi:hypothetical protein
MNTRLFITALSLLGASLVSAQNVSEDPKPDLVLDAIQEFSDHDQNIPNQPVTSAEEEVKPSEQVTSTPPNPEPSSAVLVTGNPPTEVESTAAPESSPTEAVVTSPDEESQKSENGLSVRIEKLHSGNGAVDPSQVKLRAPFPAKPLAQAPPGWRLDVSDSAPPFTREVELSPGSKITLSIRPHLLVPDSNGIDAFNIAEPGFENSLGYQQTSTVGAILANSIRQLDDDARQLSAAVDSLQQLLISLPKPPAQPEPEPALINKPATNIRKR